MKITIRSVLLYCCILFLASWAGVPILHAQTVTGAISGTVVDPTGAVIPGATLTLTSIETSQVRTAVSSKSGAFIFNAVLPGTYNLSVTAAGFQAYRQQNITITPTAKVSLHKIQLRVGSTSTTVTVQASAAHVQTQSSGNTSLITAKQFASIPDRGRNFLDYLALVPGSTTTTQTDTPGSGTFGFNGGEGQSLIQLGGIASQDIGYTPAAGFLAPNIDAIGDMKVMTGVVPAEYGARQNGEVIVSVKSGTSDFHGDVYEFNRNTDYNANTYFNNLNGRPRSGYKFNNPGFTVGGPVIIPGTAFNKSRNRLFFFFSGDFLIRHVPSGNGPSGYVVPTMAERAGNFTYVNNSAVSGPSGTGNPIVCPGGGTPSSLDPLNCSSYGYPSSTAGATMLGLFPNPTCNRTGTSDQQANAPLNLPTCPANLSTSNLIVAPFQESEPQRDYILRTDFNVTKNEHLYVRLIKDYRGTDGGNFLGGAGWGQLRTNYDIRSYGAVVNLVSILRPNLVNEFVAGENLAWQSITPYSQTAFKNNVRTNVGLGPSVLPSLFPSSQNNPQDLLPNASFGGGNFVGGAAGLSEDSRYPFYSSTRIYNITDNVSWIEGNHNLKFGFYYEVDPRTETVNNVTYNGAYNFSATSYAGGQFSNPLDTGYTYSNAYLGVYQSYLEYSAKPIAKIQLKSYQWFLQDNWKATNRLNLDFGVRFYRNLDPISRNNDPFGYFDPSLYNASKQPQYIYPGNPNFPASAVGLYEPGTGTPYQGMVVVSNTRNHLRNNPPIAVAPRIGFAWDIFGDGKTALRGGFGLFYDQLQDSNAVSNFDFLPPEVTTPQVFNSTISDLATLSSSGGGLLGPPSTNYTTPLNYKLPIAYDYDLGIQRDMGHNILLKVTYLGNIARNGPRLIFFNGDQINAVPYGADFAPQNAGLTGHPNFLRTPYQGYGSIINDGFSIDSNYNSLQVQVNKRVGRLTAGGSYTYSKTLDNSGPFFGRVLNVGVPLHRYYGPAGQDRRQNLTVNWMYSLTPAFAGRSLALREALGGWEIQGIASFISGSPSTIGAAYFYDANGASAAGNNGGPVALNILSNPVLPSSARVKPSASQAPQYLDIGAVGVPAGGPGVCTTAGGPSMCGLGNASLRADFYGPGINNWDISLFKNFTLGKGESRYFQLRLETYNTFNHTQFSGVNTFLLVPGTNSTNATFPSSFNRNFGQFNGTQAARILVIAGKLYF